MPEEPLFFQTGEAFRAWLKQNHDRADVLWVGYYKVATGKPSMRWEESVREALCYGWIDGLRKSIDTERYKIRFTPRRDDSHWSKKNIRMVNELIEQDRMQPAGIEAYNKREETNSGRASYERKPLGLSEEFEARLKQNESAWAFFQELAPGYTRTSVHWVMSAKKSATRKHRLEILIDSCAKGRRIPPLQG